MNQAKQGIQKILLNHYLILHLPGAGAFAVLYTPHKTLPGMYFMVREAPSWTIIAILVLQGIFAVALPLWYRIHFVNRIKTSKRTSMQAFLQFEKRFLTLAAPSLYLLIPGYMMSPSQGPFAAMVLFALYSLYFYFPSHKRTLAEKKLFRVEEK